MIQHKLVCQFIQRYVNIQEIFEIIRMDYDKKICINIMIINIVYNINYNIDDLNEFYAKSMLIFIVEFI